MKSFKQFLNERTISSKKATYNTSPDLIEQAETCIYRDDFQCIKKCFDEGLDPNAIEANDKSPLGIIAIMRGQFRIVELFIQQGFDVNTKYDNNSALEYALDNYHMYAQRKSEAMEIVDLLLKNGADVNYHGNRTSPLYTAIYKDDLDLVKKLISYKADVNEVNKHTSNPILMSAFLDDKLDILEEMLKSGANPHIQNKWNESVYSYLKDSNKEVHKEILRKFKL